MIGLEMIGSLVSALSRPTLGQACGDGFDRFNSWWMPSGAFSYACVTIPHFNRILGILQGNHADGPL